MMVADFELNEYQKRQLAHQRAAKYQRPRKEASIGSRVWHYGAQILIVVIVMALFVAAYLYILTPLVKNLIHALNAL